MQDSVETGGVLGMSSRQRICLGGTVSLGIFLVALFLCQAKPKQNLTEQISNDNTEYIEPHKKKMKLDEFDFL